MYCAVLLLHSKFENVKCEAPYYHYENKLLKQKFGPFYYCTSQKHYYGNVDKYGTSNHWHTKYVPFCCNFTNSMMS